MPNTKCPSPHLSRSLREVVVTCHSYNSEHQSRETCPRHVHLYLSRHLYAPSDPLPRRPRRDAGMLVEDLDREVGVWVEFAFIVTLTVTFGVNDNWPTGIFCISLVTSYDHTFSHSITHFVYLTDDYFCENI